MSESIVIPSDLKSCQELIVSQQELIDDLQVELHNGRLTGRQDTLAGCGQRRHGRTPGGS